MATLLGATIGAMVPRIRGASYPIDDAWKERVAKQLEARGERAKLCAALKCSSAALVKMLAPQTRVSRYVPAVHKYFGWPPPSNNSNPDSPRQAIVEKIMRLEDSRLTAVDALLNALLDD